MTSIGLLDDVLVGVKATVICISIIEINAVAFEISDMEIKIITPQATDVELEIVSVQVSLIKNKLVNVGFGVGITAMESCSLRSASLETGMPHVSDLSIRSHPGYFNDSKRGAHTTP